MEEDPTFDATPPVSDAGQVDAMVCVSGDLCDSCSADECWCLESECVPVLSSCFQIKESHPTAPDGPYWIDGDGVGALTAFQVYCDMTSDGGGWTLVDNNAVTAEIYSSREPGANTDINLTRGSLLPAHTWSPSPALLCISDNFNGTEGRVILAPTNIAALSYPTTATGVSFGDTWAIVDLKGNTNRGVSSFTFNTEFTNFGSIWIGSGSNATCACNYGAMGFTAIGAGYVAGSSATCSTWVR